MSKRPGGTHLTLGEYTYAFFIDDTGSETFGDPEHRVFGMGGCGILGKDLIRLINTPWHEVRRIVAGNPDAPLHAAWVTKQRNPEHMGAISSFFKANAFARVGVSCDYRTEFPPSLDVVWAVLGNLMNQMNNVLEWTWATDVAVIFEHSERLQPAVARVFGDYVPFNFNRVLPWEPYWMPKWANYPALEVADFIANAMGSQARCYAKHDDKAGFGLDYQSVFPSVARTLASYFHLTAAVEQNGRPPHV